MSLLTDARSAPPGTGIRFYGWRVVAMCALTLGMTAPGQTAGVSVFIDPMMETLDLSRSQISLAYLVGTLAGAGTMPAFGRLIDRRGLLVRWCCWPSRGWPCGTRPPTSGNGSTGSTTPTRRPRPRSGASPAPRRCAAGCSGP